MAISNDPSNTPSVDKADKPGNEGAVYNLHGRLSALKLAPFGTKPDDIQNPPVAPKADPVPDSNARSHDILVANNIKTDEEVHDIAAHHDKNFRNDVNPRNRSTVDQETIHQRSLATTIDDEEDAEETKRHLMLIPPIVLAEEAIKFPDFHHHRIARPRRGAKKEEGEKEEKEKKGEEEKEKAEKEKEDKTREGEERPGEEKTGEDRAAKPEAEADAGDAATARNARTIARGGEELKAAASLEDAAEIARGIRTGRSALKLVGLGAGVAAGTVAGIATGTLVGAVVITGVVVLATAGVIYGAYKYLGKPDEQALKGTAAETYKLNVDKETEEAAAKAKAALDKGNIATAAAQGGYAFAEVTGLADLARLTKYIVQHPIESAKKVARGVGWAYDHSGQIAEGAVFTAKHPLQALDTGAHAAVALAEGKNVTSEALAAAQTNGLAADTMAQARRMQELKSQTGPTMVANDRTGPNAPHNIGGTLPKNQDNLG